MTQGSDAKILTFLKFMTECGMSEVQEWSHFGQLCLAFQYLCIIDCKMEAKGVTPMPVAMSTACWALKMWLDGAP